MESNISIRYICPHCGSDVITVSINVIKHSLRVEYHQVQCNLCHIDSCVILRVTDVLAHRPICKN